MASTVKQRSRSKRSKRQITEINVTPFVDVMLVLLVVFMITAPLLTVGVSVDLPKTKANNVGGNDEPLIVSYNEEGKIFIQDTEVDINTLAPRIKAISENNKDVRIFIRADKNLPYGEVMVLMGELVHEGFTKVALISSGETVKAK